MPTYTVRSVIRWAPRSDQKLKFIYEERITAWNAESLDEAIELAEVEANRYATKEKFWALSLFQGYWLFDDVGCIPQGAEVFSLLRESDLEPDAYLDTFFDTGEERQTDYQATSPESKRDAGQATPCDADNPSN